MECTGEVQSVVTEAEQPKAINGLQEREPYGAENFVSTFQHHNHKFGLNDCGSCINASFDLKPRCGCFALSLNILFQ